jgi:hypothetical protein
MPNPGDFMVVATNGWVARVIRILTRSKWNHAAIFIGDGQIIEADPSGVQIADLSNYDGLPILWSDLRLPPAQATLVVAAARAQLGLEYGFLDVAAIALSTIGIITSRLDDPDSRFCSQVVAQTFLVAGPLLCVTKAANRITPGDLANIILGQPIPANW